MKFNLFQVDVVVVFEVINLVLEQLFGLFEMWIWKVLNVVQFFMVRKIEEKVVVFSDVFKQ